MHTPKMRSPSWIHHHRETVVKASVIVMVVFGLCACKVIHKNIRRERNEIGIAQESTHKVELHSIPDGAQVFCDEKPIGKTPTSVDVPIWKDRVQVQVIEDREVKGGRSLLFFLLGGGAMGGSIALATTVDNDAALAVGIVGGILGGAIAVAYAIPCFMHSRSKFLGSHVEVSEWKCDPVECLAYKEGYLDQTKAVSYPDASHLYKLKSEASLLRARRVAIEEERVKNERLAFETRKEALEREQRAADEAAAKPSVATTHPVTIVLRGHEITFYTDTSLGCMACASSCSEVGYGYCEGTVGSLCASGNLALDIACLGATKALCQSTVNENCKTICCSGN